MKKVLGLFLVFILCFSCAYASEPVQLFFDSADANEWIEASACIDGNYMNVSGVISSGAGQRIGIFVTNSNNEMVYAKQLMSGNGGRFSTIFPLSYNIEGKTYTLSIGANGISASTDISFEYTDKSNEIITNNFFNADLKIALSSYVPHLTGTLSCSQGKTINLIITDKSNKSVIANEVITYSDGQKEIDYTLSSLLTTKDYDITIDVTAGSVHLTTISAYVDSSVLLTELGGSVSLINNAYLDVSFESQNTSLVDKQSTVTANKEFNSSVPNVLPNAAFLFSVQGYEEYTSSMVTDVKRGENLLLYNALKKARPELDSDDDKIITSVELSSITGLLDLSSTAITNLNGLGQCTSVTALDISGNGVSTLLPIKPLDNLRYLYADGNNLTDLHGTPQNVRMLSASNNQLTGLMGVSDCLQLEYINASHNNIESVYGLENKSKLKYLKLNNNRLNNILQLESCPALVHLDFANNLVVNVESLNNMYFLKYLDFRNNPVESADNLPYNYYHTFRYWGDWMTNFPVRDSIYE